MIDLTPLDVRNKRGDFKKLMRGYDPQEVDVFLELVAERLEGLVRENLQLKERTQTLQQQVTSQLGREQAVQDALVTAQELRADIKAQSQREAEHALKEAESEARRLLAEAEAQVRNKLRGIERRVDGAGDVLVELERRRTRFLKEYRQLLQRELDVVEVEEGRTPLEDRAIDLELGPTTGAAVRAARHAVRDGGRSLATAPAPEPDDEITEEMVVANATPVPEADPPVEIVPADDVPDAPEAAGVENAPGEPDPEPDTVVLTPTPLPTALETPSFTTHGERAPTADGAPPPVEELSASMEAEAVAQAQSQVVEVTGADADRLADVPRLEQVLAEAGAEMHHVQPEAVTRPPQMAEEIAPPRIRSSPEDALLLYLDPDDAD